MKMGYRNETRCQGARAGFWASGLPLWMTEKESAFLVILLCVEGHEINGLTLAISFAQMVRRWTDILPKFMRALEVVPME
jgi:hypothetical protein